METQQGMKRWRVIIFALTLAALGAAYAWDTIHAGRKQEHWTLTLDTSDNEVEVRELGGKRVGGIDFHGEQEITVTIKRRAK